jgi:serine phosphatase RsbU (regulator of sigma subunit)
MGDVRARLGELVARAQDSTPDHLAGLVASYAAAAGGRDAVMYLADYGQLRLIPVPYPGMPPREPLTVEGTVAGRAYRTVTAVYGLDGGSLWLPLLDGSERLGVLEVGVPAPADGVPADGAPADGVPPGGKPANGALAGGVPSGGVPAGGVPADGVPPGGTPANGALAGGVPAGGVPSAGAPVDGVSAGGAPADEEPAGGVLADGASADEVLAAWMEFARVVASQLMGRWSYGDAFELARRLRPMRLPAEIQWRLLPPTTFATDRLVVTGLLEPWDEVGGDAFDYAVNGDTAHLALFDAMGHQLGATLLATVAVGGYRNARRARLDLVGTYSAIDAGLAAQFGRRAFVTGLLMELDTVTGRLTWVSAGHLPPLLVRGGKLIRALTGRPALPMGLRLQSAPPTVHAELLEPGDRLVLYTDGVTEARYRGQFLTEERLADFVVRESASGHSPPEVLRRLIRAVLDHSHGRLQDDATLLLVEWR